MDSPDLKDSGAGQNGAPDPAPRPPAPATTPEPLQASRPAPVPSSEPQAPAPKTTPSASETPHPGVGVDLGKILLPKKEPGPSTLSAQRVNAAAVLEAAQAPLQPKASEAAPSAPTQAEKPVSESHEEMQALRTYKGDIEEIVHDRKVSLVDIAAAQARRGPQSSAAAEPARNYARILEVGAGILLLVLAGTVAYLALTYRSERPAAAYPTSYIFVDQVQPVAVPEGVSRELLMNGLEQLRENMKLSVGLIARLYLVRPAAASAAAPVQLTSEDFFSTISSNAPASFVRSLAPEFLLGIHSYGSNQAFLIFKTNLYDQAYAGLLEWEPTMQQDLLPLFSRDGQPQASGAGNTASEAIATPQLLQTPFSDRVVDNHDARVILNAQGDIALLWTFIDRQTLVITTNEDTLREIISRLTQAPVVPIPGQ